MLEAPIRAAALGVTDSLFAGVWELGIRGSRSKDQEPRTLRTRSTLTLLPRLAAVRGAINAALRLWSVAGAHRGRKNNVGIVRVDHDARDAARLFQTHVRPRFAGVGGLVNAVAEGDVAADEGFTGADPISHHGHGRAAPEDSAISDHCG